MTISKLILSAFQNGVPPGNSRQHTMKREIVMLRPVPRDEQHSGTPETAGKSQPPAQEAGCAVPSAPKPVYLPFSTARDQMISPAPVKSGILPNGTGRSFNGAIHCSSSLYTSRCRLIFCRQTRRCSGCRKVLWTAVAAMQNSRMHAHSKNVFLHACQSPVRNRRTHTISELRPV